MKYKLTADYKGLSEALEIIKERLTEYKLHRKDIQKNILAAEEVMNALLEHAENAENIYLSIRRFLDEVSIEISVSGKEFQLEKELNPGTPINSEDLGVDTERAIRGMILKSFLGDIKYRHRAGVNTIRIVVTRFKRASLYLTLGAIILAIGLGILVKSFVPETIYMPVNDNVLDPVKTIYMNALKMIVAPVVFFSIVSCIGHFSDLSELGRIGGKTIGMYLLTTIIATLLGTGVVYLLSPGVAGSFNIESAGATMNMDGTCIYLSVFAFALARICGVTIPPAAIISVLISIIVLSVGAPGTPGSGLVCLSVLLTQLNVPIEALALVMGIDSIMGMMRCMSNCLGDTAVGTIVAKQEGLLDVETYNNKI